MKYIFQKIISFKWTKILLIISVAFVLRFWKLDTYPAFNADEAAIGYNAYSLIDTGLDEHGNSWPVHFQSFNDFKPGFYFYIVLPFVWILGLNEWAVRIPGALMGVGSVFVVYLLIGRLKLEKLFNERISNKKLEIKLSEIGVLLLAISPWHIHFSRGGWEVNAATFFILFAVYQFILFIEKNKWKNVALSIIFFVFSLYTYHAARVIVPLLGVGLLIIYWKDLTVFKKYKNYILYALFLFVLCLPLVVDFTKGAVSSRAVGVGLFADTGPLSRIDRQRGEHDNFMGLPAKIFHNKPVNYGLAFLDNWTSHYHGEFLFLSGEEIQRNKVPETGQMYAIDIIWILVGLWVLLKNTKIKSTKLILFWLIVAPVAAALTFQSPHALRSHNMIISLVVIASIGLYQTLLFINQLPKKNLIKILNVSVILLMFWQFARYQHMYWVHMAKEYVFSSQYGVKELVNYVNQVEDKYKNVVVTNRYDQPYILFLFYKKYDPAEFQNNHSLTAVDQFGFSTVEGFDKYRFIKIDNWDKIRSEYPNSLIAGTEEEIPEEANIVKDVFGSNGHLYFRVVAN